MSVFERHEVTSKGAQPTDKIPEHTSKPVEKAFASFTTEKRSLFVTESVSKMGAFVDMGTSNQQNASSSVAPNCLLEIELMSKTVIARIYVDGSIEYMPPSDSVHPPVEGELRVTLEEDNTQHLETFNAGEWVNLGDLSEGLLKKYDLEQFGSF